MSPAEHNVGAVARGAAGAFGDVERFIARGTREFALANVALFAAGFTTFALIYCVQPIMPMLGRDFGIDAATASLSLSATTQCLSRFSRTCLHLEV